MEKVKREISAWVHIRGFSAGSDIGCGDSYTSFAYCHTMFFIYSSRRDVYVCCITNTIQKAIIFKLTLRGSITKSKGCQLKIYLWRRFSKTNYCIKMSLAWMIFNHQKIFEKYSQKPTLLLTLLASRGCLFGPPAVSPLF